MTSYRAVTSGAKPPVSGGIARGACGMISAPTKAAPGSANYPEACPRSEVTGEDYPMVDQTDDPARRLRKTFMRTRCTCPADHRAFIDERVVRTPGSDCWDWAGQINVERYGIVHHDGRQWMAHRLAYFAHRGPIPEGLVLDHTCRNPSCVNPAHLEAVTDWVNIMRGNGYAARNYAKEECVRGHKLPSREPGTATHRQCEQCRAAEYRNNVARAKARGVPEGQHGTANAYSNYQCRCDECKVAGAEMNAQQRAGRLARGLAPDDPRHGTYNAYTNWKCRCSACRRASSEHLRQKRSAA